MTLYEVLDLDKKTATPENIRRAYRRKAAAAHPDNAKPVGDFFAIQQANRIRADPEAKHIYDETEIVTGDEKLAEEAMMLLVKVSAEVLSNNEAADLPKMIRLTVAHLRDSHVNVAATIEKCIKQVERRWQGAEQFKNLLLLNMTSRAIEATRQVKVHDRALHIIEGATYLPADRPADELLSRYFLRNNLMGL